MKWLVLALLLFATTCHAIGPEALLEVFSGYSYGTSINGISSLSSSGTMDTGTQTFTLTANPITVAALCNSSSAGVQSGVTLAVDGVDRDYITCNNSNTSRTLSYAPTAGSHTVRIYGTSDNTATATFSANSFRIPGTP